MAVASLVLGIVSIVLTFAGTIPGILAVVFGAIGRGRAVAGTHGKALATWGLALGIVGLVLSVVVLSMIDAGGGF
jgi:hypothetical protein